MSVRDLHPYTSNPFQNGNVSLACLLAFTSDHIQRMTANVSSVVVPRITATNTALTAVSNAFTDDETKLGLRKARKLAKNNYRDALPVGIGKIALAVQVKYGERAPEFSQCFPHKRSVFGSCPDDKLANELQAMINGVTALQAALGAQVVTDATALLTGWNAVYSPSESASGAKTTTEAVKQSVRAALELELFKTLLTVALNFPGDTAKIDLYMNQSLLWPHTQTSSTPAPVPPAPLTTDP
jgi:hypothetical protein